MGGRGGSGSFGFASINAARAKIANLKKEQLFVFSPSGDLLYKEQGTAQHAGYGDTDYKGNIVLHNHPEGVLPVPSLKDIETWQKSGAKAIIIESRDATFTLSGPHNKGFYETLAYNHNYVRRAVREAANKVSADYKAGKYKSPQGGQGSEQKSANRSDKQCVCQICKSRWC